MIQDLEEDEDVLVLGTVDVLVKAQQLLPLALDGAKIEEVFASEV